MSLPIAVIDNVDTTTPVTYYVHTDHLSRPILMTDGAKATVWQAEWSPWGAPLSITASPEMNQRFPGQWYQLEAGLHYNWHRHYDPSLGRYTRPDPLGFVDGPSVFAYVALNPLTLVDPTGLSKLTVPKTVIDGRTGQPVIEPAKPGIPSVSEPDLRKEPTPQKPSKGAFCAAVFASCMAKCLARPICKLPGAYGAAGKAGCVAGCAAKTAIVCGPALF